MDDINRIIDDCIKDLADDSISHGASSLVELANIWANAGMTKQSFMDIRQYIIKEAKAITGCPVFIDLKLEQAERLLHSDRRIDNVVRH